MAAPNANTFDLATPRRPGTNDFNGIAKVDDAAFAPDPTTMPNAAEWNTIELLLLAVTRVVPVVILSVIGGGAPTINNFPSASANVVIGTFTVVRNSAGNISITWPANTFPPSACAPMAHLNAGPGMIHAVATANGVNIFTYNSAGTATDLSFTVAVY